MIHYLRRQVARYRWKRVINKVILAVRLSHPRRPVFGMHDNGDANSNISAGGRIDQKENRSTLIKHLHPKIDIDVLNPQEFSYQTTQYN